MKKITYILALLFTGILTAQVGGFGSFGLADKQDLVKDRQSSVNGQRGYKVTSTTFDWGVVSNFDNTIIEVRYSYDLEGDTIVLPENVTLKFEGGVLKNGTVTGDNTSINADSTPIFEDVVLNGSWSVDKFFVTWFGAIGDGAFDNADIINDVLRYNFEFNLFFPSGNYIISKPLEIIIKPKGLFGQLESNRPQAWISTTTDFAHKSMVRNWTDSDYEISETDPDLPPDEIENIIRYHQISNLRFYIENDNETTAIDMCSAQESAIFKGLIFSGLGASKGWPIRIRTNSSNEASFNSCIIRDVVVYRSDWKGELYAKGKGSDLHVENWVTSPSDHVETPFQIDVIDSTFLNIHCEAYSSITGRVFHLSGSDTSISQSFIIYQDVLTDIFYCDNSAGSSGFGRIGVSINNLKLYPHAGVPMDASSMNLVNDVSQSNSSIVKMAYNGLSNLSFINHYSYKKLDALDGSGRRIELSANHAFKTIENLSLTSSTDLQIDYSLLSKNHGGIVTLTGRNAADDKLVVARFIIGISEDGDVYEYGGVIDKYNYADDLTLVYDSESGAYSISTETTTISNVRLSISGNLDFNSFM